MWIARARMRCAGSAKADRPRAWRVQGCGSRRLWIAPAADRAAVIPSGSAVRAARGTICAHEQARLRAARSAGGEVDHAAQPRVAEQMRGVRVDTRTRVMSPGCRGRDDAWIREQDRHTGYVGAGRGNTTCEGAKGGKMTRDAYDALPLPLPGGRSYAFGSGVFSSCTTVGMPSAEHVPPSPWSWRWCRCRCARRALAGRALPSSSGPESSSDELSEDDSPNARGLR
jgi:hypothetical protein